MRLRVGKWRIFFYLEAPMSSLYSVSTTEGKLIDRPLSELNSRYFKRLRAPVTHAATRCIPLSSPRCGWRRGQPYGFEWRRDDQVRTWREAELPLRPILESVPGQHHGLIDHLLHSWRRVD